MSSNPFEPPRTTDLEGSGITARGGLFLSTEALQELSAAAPWVRWMTRVTSASIALGIIKTVVNLGKLDALSAKAGQLFGMAISTAISIMILRALRRYAAASDRLRSGAHQATGEAIAAQASYFKLLGVLLSIGGSLVALVLLLSVVAWVLK